ncbi:HAD domain-containing protein [Paracidovorax valerianellae]|uniref:NLI interacting factor-like phosphatase n=1 Tax=Paracidovorax valerianellae TaxID=187868 RepID=A0A1G6YXU8_9BURK|nr:HAD domain-containing protein [Paracidovorax valerianellae]MDA8447327.1 HAD domain-containing protein [Paracidovorax valerianellae]SDD94465.1 hypothetical protein SAMN05192589_110175 [Paracidovorax valerianellae]
MTKSTLRPIIFLDIDDVLCPNQPYGSSHVFDALFSPQRASPELYERLFSEEAIAVLNQLVAEFTPAVVLTTSWLLLLQQHHFVDLFNRCGLSCVASSLHDCWGAFGSLGDSRLQVIEEWLEKHHAGEPVLVLDDIYSGESLIDSFLSQTGRAVLCEGQGGLTSNHLEPARRALRRPYSRHEPWI